MTNARLTDNPLLYFGLWYRFQLPHQIFLGLFNFRVRDHGLCRGFRAGVVADAGARNILAINQPSVDTMRVADRDAIVERHKESIGVSVNKAHAIGHVGMTTVRMTR
jgi:hypothetical protein